MTISLICYWGIRFILQDHRPEILIVKEEKDEEADPINAHYHLIDKEICIFASLF